MFLSLSLSIYIYKKNPSKGAVLLYYICIYTYIDGEHCSCPPEYVMFCISLNASGETSDSGEEEIEEESEEEEDESEEESRPPKRKKGKTGAWY